MAHAISSYATHDDSLRSGACMGRHGEQRFRHILEITAECIARLAMQHFPLRFDSVSGLDFCSSAMQVGRFHDVRPLFV